MAFLSLHIINYSSSRIKVPNWVSLLNNGPNFELLKLLNVIFTFKYFYFYHYFRINNKSKRVRKNCLNITSLIKNFKAY